jgi:hypothetical protein
MCLSLVCPLLPACDGDEEQEQAGQNATSSRQLSTDALVGRWELDPEDRREYLRVLGSGDFSGTVTYNGLATKDNPADTYSDVAGKWTLEGNLLTFYVTESPKAYLKNTAVEHRIMAIDDQKMVTVFEGIPDMVIYRRK